MNTTPAAVPVETPAHQSRIFTTGRHSYRVPADPAADDTLMGLAVTVYRRGDGSDATWDGISGKFDRLVVVGTIDLSDPLRNRFGLPAVTPFAARTWRHLPVSPFFRGYATAPAVLVRRRMGLEYLVHVEPGTFDPDAGQWVRAHTSTMFGGNYVAGDSRFSQLVETQIGGRFYGAVPVHDRVEQGLAGK